RGEATEREAVRLTLHMALGMDSCRRVGLDSGSFLFLGRMPGGEVEVGGRSWLPGKDFIFSIHRLKKVCKRANRLGLTQEQKAFRLERIMKRGQDFFLQVRIEINQQVAATDQVHA